MLRRLSLGASILACLALTSHAFAQAGPSPAPAGNPGEGGGAAPSAGSSVSNGSTSRYPQRSQISTVRSSGLCGGADSVRGAW